MTTPEPQRAVPVPQPTRSSPFDKAYDPQRAVRNLWGRWLVLATACLVAGGALGAALTPAPAPRVVATPGPTVRVSSEVRVTVTAAPVTVTASAIPAPTVTRTVARPAPTVTRTITRTVTASPEVTP